MPKSQLPPPCWLSCLHLLFHLCHHRHHNRQHHDHCHQYHHHQHCHQHHHYDDEHQRHHDLHHRPHFTRDLGPFSTLTEPRSVHLAFTSLDKHPLAFLTRPSDSTVNIARYATCTTQTTGFDKTLYVQYSVMFTDPAHFCINGRHYRNKKCKSIERCSDSNLYYMSSPDHTYRH